MSFNRNNLTFNCDEIIVRKITTREFKSQRVWNNEQRKYVEDANAPISIWKLICGYCFVSGGTLNIQIESKKKPFNYGTGKEQIDKLIFVSPICEFRVRKQNKINPATGIPTEQQYHTLHILDWERIISDDDIDPTPTIETKPIQAQQKDTNAYESLKKIDDIDWFDEVENKV